MASDGLSNGSQWQIPTDSFLGRTPFKGGVAVEADWNRRVLWEVREANHHHDALTRAADIAGRVRNALLHSFRWMVGIAGINSHEQESMLRLRSVIAPSRRPSPRGPALSPRLRELRLGPGRIANGRNCSKGLRLAMNGEVERSPARESDNLTGVGVRTAKPTD